MLLERVCQECGSSFKGGPRAYYCNSCREVRKKAAKADYIIRKRAGEVRTLGSKDSCQRCGKEYIVEGGLQRYCPECQPIHSAEYDRTTSLSFYHEKKEELNPVRNSRRQIGEIICPVCQTTFNPGGTAKVTCSDTCERDYINKKWRERFYKPELREKLVSQVELARILGVSKAAILGRRNRGTLPPFDSGKRWRYETIKYLLPQKEQEE